MNPKTNKKLEGYHEIGPIMFKNPNTGKFIDLSGLFDKAEQYEIPGKPKVFARVIDETIKMLATRLDFEEHESLELNNLFFGLYLVRDVFTKMEE